MNFNYLEYDQLANSGEQELYCVTLILRGCMDEDYLEYNPFANVDDSSCLTFKVYGCTDPTQCNYDHTATVDDDSCYNNDLGCGCDTPAAEQGYDCDGNCLSDVDSDGICDEFEIEDVKIRWQQIIIGFQLKQFLRIQDVLIQIILNSIQTQTLTMDLVKS